MSEPVSSSSLAGAIAGKLGAIPLIGGLVWVILRPKTFHEFAIAFSGSAIGMVYGGAVAVDVIRHHFPWLAEFSSLTTVGVHCFVGVVAYAFFALAGDWYRQIKEDPMGFFDKLRGK